MKDIRYLYISNISHSIYGKMNTFNELFGPSIYLLVLDVFLENPEELMNVREVARRINRNPGSVSRVLPRLLNKSYVTCTQIGAKIVAYKLNQGNTVVQLLLEFCEKIEDAHD